MRNAIVEFHIDRLVKQINDLDRAPDKDWQEKYIAECWASAREELNAEELAQVRKDVALIIR